MNDAEKPYHEMVLKNEYRKGRPFTDEDRAELKRLHGEGMALNRIAKEMDRPLGSVASVARKMELFFDRTQIAAAAKAKQIDNRARRAALIEWQYERARHLAERLDAEEFRTTTRTQQGAISETFDYVPADDELLLARAVNQYAKTAADLEKVDAGKENTEDRSVIRKLMDKLRESADE